MPIGNMVVPMPPVGFPSMPVKFLSVGFTVMVLLFGFKTAFLKSKSVSVPVMPREAPGSCKRPRRRLPRTM